jgi:hypothetical protein
MAMEKQTYSSSQTNTTLITPASGKAILVWDIIIDTDSSAELNFNTSIVTVAKITNSGRMEDMLVDEQGASDEVLSVTCGTGNTTVKVHYYEV